MNKLTYEIQVNDGYNGHTQWGHSEFKDNTLYFKNKKNYFPLGDCDKTKKSITDMLMYHSGVRRYCLVNPIIANS